MSDERFEQDEREDEEVEAHKKKSVMANDEPGSDDGSDEVEAHQHAAKHKNL